MPILKCKMCGGDIVLDGEKTFGTCEYCGSTMTLPKVSDEQRAALFNRGNHFRRIGDFDKALAIYENIVKEDDTDAEAHWCCVLCRFGIEYVEDPNTYEFIPTCHRASFDSILEDVDYLAAIEHSDGITRRQYQKEAVKIAEVQKGILATSQNEEPFDVFICYKETDDATKQRTKDSLDAQEIYYQLTNEGYRVFFSRITLEDKAGAEYEPYIFAALNSAKVMVVIGSKPEYFNAVWVKNEWNRFLALMRKDRSKLLLPCYKGMDPYDLPEALTVLQSYDMSKIGFIQDLIRGIKKVIKTNESNHAEKETEQGVKYSSKIDINNLLRRGFLTLEDEDWKKANELFDSVLNYDAENSEAYLGIMLGEGKYVNKDAFEDAFVSKLVNVADSRYYARAKQFAGPDLSVWFDNIEMKRRDAENQLQNKIETHRKDLEECRKRISRAQSMVCASHGKIIGLKSDGTAIAAGYRSIYNPNPEQFNVSGWTDIVAVACSASHAVGLKSDGTVVATGNKEFKQFNFSDWTDIIAVACGYERTVGLKKDGTAIAIGYSKYSPYPEQFNVSGWTDIVAVACSDNHVVGLKSDGTVVATGSNKFKACNVSDWTDIVAVACSPNRTVGLKSDGTVVATGNNEFKQCDVSDWTDIIAVAYGTDSTIGLRSNGTVVAVGEIVSDECNVSGWKLFNSVDTIDIEFEQASKKNRERLLNELPKEKASLEAEMANLKGLFAAKRKKEIEARLAEIEQQLASIR